jgi:hypothetical protein
MTIDIGSQRFWAVTRQVLSVAAIVMGALTQALSSIKLPIGVSSVLVAVGGIVLAIEHYVADPSTGSTSVTTPTPEPPPTKPPAPPT